MLPPPGEICESMSTASARIAPIAMDDERVEEGSRVELAGLVMLVWMGKEASAWVVITMEKDG